jgi:hypothetical protein
MRQRVSALGVEADSFGPKAWRVISSHGFCRERGMTQLELPGGQLRRSDCEMRLCVDCEMVAHLTIRGGPQDLQLCHAFSRGQIMR